MKFMMPPILKGIDPRHTILPLEVLVDSTLKENYIVIDADGKIYEPRDEIAQRIEKHWPALEEAAKATGLDPATQFFSKGYGLSHVRDLNFVDDVIDALLIGGASELHGEIFNLGDTNYKSLLDMAKDVIDVSGKGSYKLVPFPDERKKINVGDTYLDISKIKNVLGWQPKTGFKDGVKRTLEYFKGKEEHYF